MPGMAGQSSHALISGDQHLSSDNGTGWQLTAVCLQIQHELERLDATQVTIG